jgi:hypothetical protein
MRCRVVLALTLGLAGCARPSAPAAQLGSYEYAVTPPVADAWTVQVEARLRNAPTPRLVDPDAPEALRDVVLVEAGRERPLPRQDDAWLAPECRDACTLRYSLDLAAAAAGCQGHECMRRIGDAFFGAASAWMLRPEAGDADIHVTLRGGDATRFATGLRRDGHGGYALAAWELGEAAYTAFGELRRSAIDVPGGPLEVVLLGTPLAMGDAATLAWVRDAALCVASLYDGRFPAPATIFVLKARRGDGVVFGRVMSLTGGSVMLLFGTDTKPASEHDDWVAVHELSHLGTASLVGEAHWLEEGLATYYEPILRERAGWMTEAQLWKHFVDSMPRGEPQPGDPPRLEDRDDTDSTYWGGALFCLLVDLEIRKATHGAKSLDDVMRAVHDRLGDATHGTKLAEFMRIGDEATGTRALDDVYAHFAVAGEPVDLEAIGHSLGVFATAEGPDGVVTLRDDAPLSAIRRGIATGGGH